jgi:hypothetical protein
MGVTEAAIPPGTVVDYHGSYARGRYIVAGVTFGTLTLVNEAWPASHRATLCGVRFVSVTPTGERRTLCAYCHLPADITPADHCPNHGRHTLPCTEHAHPAPATFARDRYTA